MAFITLNGIELDAAGGSGTEEDVEIGEGVVRAFDGSLLRSSRSFKRVWAYTTVLDTPANARAFRRLLQGRFRHWAFETAALASDTGLVPASSTLATSVAGGKFGNALQLGATTGLINYAGLGGVSGVDGFTLLILRKNGAAWDDYHLTWDKSGALSAVYLNGAAQATSLPSWITSYTHATGTLILNNTTGAVQLYDEMVAMAFEAPLSSWSSQLATWRGSNLWSASPALVLGGSMTPDTPSVQGKPAKGKLQQAYIGGVFYDNAESFPFELWEA